MDEWTVTTFAPHVGTAFRLESDGDDLALVLSDASVRGGDEPLPRGARAQFSLTFRGPREPLLSQRIYRLDHEALGPIDLFLVPVGVDSGGATYEAAFA